MNLRKYFQGDDIPPQTKAVFDKIGIKDIVGTKNANQIKTYTTDAFKKIRPVPATAVGSAGITPVAGNVYSFNFFTDYNADLYWDNFHLNDMGIKILCRALKYIIYHNIFNPLPRYY